MAGRAYNPPIAGWRSFKCLRSVHGKRCLKTLVFAPVKKGYGSVADIALLTASAVFIMPVIWAWRERDRWAPAGR